MDVAPNKLLDLEDPRLGFKLSGTSDCVVLDGEIERTIGMSQALRAVLELKKKVSERDVKQAATELISADVHAQALKPIAVVTDLVNDWRFLWLQGRTIKVLRTPDPSEADPEASRRCASLLLRRLLAEGAGVQAERLEATEVLEALPIPIAKRQKLSPVKEARGGRGDASEAANLTGTDDEEDDVDGPGWDEEDHRQLLFRQVRQMIRHTPWLHEVCRPPLRTHMSTEARNMFG